MEAVNTEAIVSVEPTDENALREAVRMEMHRTGMSQARLAKESGIHQTRLNLWLGGKYTGNGQGVAQELARWFKAATERREQAATGSLIETPDWLPTPTANTIMNTLLYAQNARDIALIYGGAGVGKTFTARRYQEDHPCVWIAVNLALERMVEMGYISRECAAKAWEQEKTSLVNRTVLSLSPVQELNED